MEEPDIDIELTCRGSGKDGGKLRAHPLDCEKYYSCKWDGHSFIIKLRKCPEGTRFVYDTQGCVDKMQAPPCVNQTKPADSRLRDRCNSLISTTPEADYDILKEIANEFTQRPNQLALQTSHIMPPDNSCPSEGVFTIPGECTRFYKCIRSGGQNLLPMLMKCPNEFVFIESKCVKSGSYDCPQRTIRSSTGNNYLGFNNGFSIPLNWYSELIQL
jgi:hypothetical protein